MSFLSRSIEFHGWKYEVGNRRMPQYVGRFINTYVYEQLPPGVLDKLRELNPVTEGGYRVTQHHRLLTDTGNIHLDRQITSTITIMALSDNKADFKANFARVHTRALGGTTSKPLRLVAKPTPKPLPLFPLIDAASNEK